jgi:hypothetical protein
MVLKLAWVMVRESAKALALMLALWSLMVLVWVMALAQYLRNTQVGYRLAKYRLCKLCRGQQNHPHNKALGCNPYPQKTDSGYPNQFGVQSDSLVGQRK